MPAPAPLPIDAALPALRDALATSRNVVLQAPPGAGKTTRVPLALLDAPWLDARRIVMLEPRRLATRAAARRMAATLGESVGGRVGFRVRGETRVGALTRVEVVTEGVLTRMLLADPGIDDVGLVIFDEFHERNLQGDVGLALALESQDVLRADLRLLVMSATLDGAAVSALLGNAPVVSSEGRQFPVDVRHVARRADQRVEGATAAAIRAALVRDEGSVLAFLPGAGEIRRTLELLTPDTLPAGVRVHPLYGDLAPAEQDAAIAAPAAGERKVVLATSIAETSLTIEGVRVVVDSGLSRVPRFSPRTAMTRLETVRVSRASAEQRRGRAGRTMPGVCYRLWAIEDDAGLLARSTPEIVEADLAPLALDLVAAGIGDVSALRWLDAPPAAALAQARELLEQLEAIEDGRITAHGSAMSALGTHPRLAHMMLRARDDGLGATACTVAALLEERDVLRHDSVHRDPDLRSRVALLADGERARDARVDRDALRRVAVQSAAWRKHLAVPRDEGVDVDATGAVLALAYPDRIAQRRGEAGGRYLLRNGLGAELSDLGSLAGSSMLAVAEVDGRLPHARIFLAAPLEPAAVERELASQIVREDAIEWDAAAGIVRARRLERLGALVLRHSTARDVNDEQVARMLLEAIVRGDGLALRWDAAALQLRDRIAFLHRLDAAAWPDVGEDALRASMEQWLLPHLVGLRRRGEVEQLDVARMLSDMLTWEQRRQLDRLAPSHVEVPTGSRIPVDYADPTAPVLAVRLQEVFGLAETPRIADGRVALTLHLLSPARRPVQVTRDLAGFWRTSYFDVRKEMRGRYPKHEWPEDPLHATPTRRAKPRPA